LKIDYWWNGKKTLTVGQKITGEPDRLVIEPKWLKPSLGWVKLNWGAAISSSSKIMGVGVVARNDEGAVLAGLSAPVPYVVDPTTVEVMAAWRAVKLGIEMGYQQIILERDSMLTICALNQATPCMSGYGQMIEDIQVILLSFSSFVVRHVGWKANFAAQTLAKNELSLVSDLMWVEECPPSIQHIVISENLSSA
jgi:ribonuclease HI